MNLRIPVLILAVWIKAYSNDTLRVETYIGTAVDLKSGKFLYSEEHLASYEGEKHVRSTVLYRDAEKKVIAQKQIELNGSSIAKFRMEDFRYGTIEGAEPTSDGIRVYARSGVNEEMKQELLQIPLPTATDAGLNELVRQNWKRIQKNEEVDFHLGVPSQLNYYHFQVKKDHEEQLNGKAALVVRFESEHWFIRLFVDPIKVWYDIDTRRAVKYEGISNVYNEKGKSYIVRVTFDKPGP